MKIRNNDSEEWKEDKPSNGIDGNEFRIISLEKLSEVKRLLEELMEVGDGVKLRVEEGVEEVKPQENHEGKS
jgi:hypothetical protein